jgi:hypothetical protein
LSSLTNALRGALRRRAERLLRQPFQRTSDARVSPARLLPLLAARGGHPFSRHPPRIDERSDAVIVKIVPNDKGNPPGKLADAEVHFMSGPLEGLKLLGFAVWERKTGGGRNVTFPARQFSVNGERRSFALLRPVSDATAQSRLREVILQAYAEFETEAALASAG